MSVITGRVNRSAVWAAVIGGALLGLLTSGACDDESDGPCADAANQADCEGVAPWDANQCGWVTIRRFSADGACNVEDVREECVEFVGTEAGCGTCMDPGDEIVFVPAEGEPGEVLVTTTICGPRPPGWRSCIEASGNPACACQGC
jgi:hypothetical protein